MDFVDRIVIIWVHRDQQWNSPKWCFSKRSTPPKRECRGLGSIENTDILPRSHDEGRAGKKKNSRTKTDFGMMSGFQQNSHRIHIW